MDLIWIQRKCLFLVDSDTGMQPLSAVDVLSLGYTLQDNWPPIALPTLVSKATIFVLVPQFCFASLSCGVCVCVGGYVKTAFYFPKSDRPSKY